MKVYIDSEFNEERGFEYPIQLISLALVKENGEVFYAVCANGWKEEDCSDWVKQNVLPHLEGPYMTRAEIKNLLERRFLPPLPNGEKYEFWGYFADYDWVLFAQVFGRMIDLPKHFPMYCRGIKQEMDRLGLKKSDMPKQEGKEHNALADARHIKAMYEFILSYDQADREHPS